MFPHVGDASQRGGRQPEVVSRRPRILLALEPAMLADAVAALLEEAGQDDVEVLAVGATPQGRYDGAIVTVDLADLDAGVVIHLPDERGGAGIGRAETAVDHRDVELADVRAVLEVLDEHCASSHPRAGVLRTS